MTEKNLQETDDMLWKRRESEEAGENAVPDGSPPEGARDEGEEVTAWMEKAHRLAAELDNTRKRARRDVERARRDERVAVLAGFLDVLDNFDRALALQGAESNQWLEGFEATRAQMLDVLARFRVQPFESLHEHFDPNWHEAVAMASVPGQEEGTIVEVIQAGYVLNKDDVIRPAKVVVAKG